MNRLEMTVKKEGWQGGGTRTIRFSSKICDFHKAEIKPSGKILHVSVADGLPNDSS